VYILQFEHASGLDPIPSEPNEFGTELLSAVPKPCDHAFDLYRILAMMTEEEYEAAEGFRDRFAGDEIVKEAQGIVSDLFADMARRSPTCERK